MLKQKNSKKQGDVGLGAAISHFTRAGWTVCIPLTDSQDYDLIVDEGSQPIRVQIKTTTYKKPSGNYEVNLTVKGGNRTSIGKIKKLNKEHVDALFIVTEDGSEYFIPVREMTSLSTITLCATYDRFRITNGVSPNGSEAGCNPVALTRTGGSIPSTPTDEMSS